MARLVSLVVLGCVWMVLFSGTAPAFAEEKTLSYDDGTADTWLENLGAGTLESIMFFMEHPATVQRFRLMFKAAGPVEIHLWGDGGGNDPDRSKDLVAPISRTIEENEIDQWVEFSVADLDAPGGDRAMVEVRALRYLHVGIIRQTGGPPLALDTSSAGQGWSAVYPANDPVTKYGISDGNYMARVDVNYHDKATDLLFEDLTEAAGLSASSRPAWGDIDNDGDDDLLASASKLFRNNGDGSFTDISEAAGITGISGSGVFADYDNDGHLDYYAFGSGDTEETRDRLVHNNGDGTFTAVDQNEGHPSDLVPTEAAAWADYDRDGWVDLYVASYEVRDEEGNSTCYGDRLWKNLGFGVFKDVTRESGMEQIYAQCGRGLAWGDFDNDGWPDLYVANYRLDPNFLFHNNGDGTFTDVAEERGVKGVMQQLYYGHSIGADWGDFDNDGDLDLFVGNLAHPRFIDFSDKSMLYLNSGAPDYTFTDIRESAGIAYSETHSDPVFFDYDNDGWLDLFVTGVYTEYISFLYHNNRDQTFTETGYETGLWLRNGWGVSVSDYDRDGDLDVMTKQLFRNGLDPDGSSNHWLQVQIIGHKTNRAGIGTRVRVVTPAGGQIREVQGGKGTGAQNSMVLHFGLGQATEISEVRAFFADGGEATVENAVVDTRIVIEESGTPECRNQDGECLSATRLHTCRNWTWVDIDCPDGWTCEDRFCVNPNEPECLFDSDCGECAFCTNSQTCQEIETECRQHADCSEGLICKFTNDPCIGFCVECLNDSTCDDCFTCDTDSNTCVPVETDCETDEDCGDGQVCEPVECGGECVDAPDGDAETEQDGDAPECVLDMQCGSCETCEDGVCTAMTDECADHEDCGEGMECVPGACASVCQPVSTDGDIADGDDGSGNTGGGGGCTGVPPSSAWWLAGLGGLFFRRRRRR